MLRGDTPRCFSSGGPMSSGNTMSVTLVSTKMKTEISPASPYASGR
jgi:hypothetical protein